MRVALAVRLLGGTVVALLVALPAGTANAQSAAEQELAEKWAPVVRLQLQEEECGHGEPYEPVDVEVVLDNLEVAFRGPWDKVNLLKVGATGEDIGRGFAGYHLDLPGDPLRPGCDYEQWSDRVTVGSEPTVYARVVGEPGRPGQLALQYWFFYLFNDFNDLHEGDWEMVQLLFDADTVEEALSEHPVAVGYSQHEGAERAEWGEEKLELVDGTHPVVYAAVGSHANYFSDQLFLGRSAAQGVGCDDTTGPSRDVRPRVAAVPSATEDYLAVYPWLGYEGRWGEKQPAFYNGPTGPNLKDQWTAPLTWAEEEWRDQSFPMPVPTAFGRNATDFFCDAVAFGSSLLTRLIRDPVPVAAFLLGLVALLGYAAVKTTWEPGTPLRLERRRAWGQLVSASRRMFWGHFRLFAGIGLVFVPIGLLIAGLQAGLFYLTGLRGALDGAGESNTFVVTLALLLGLLFTLAGLSVVQAATARAMVAIDGGRPISALGAYRELRGSVRFLVGAVIVVVAAVGLLVLSVFLVPIGIWLLGRWQLSVQAVVLEERRSLAALQRSSELVRGRWWRAAAIGLTVAALGLLSGPLLGALLLFVTDASFNVVNIVSGLVYTLTIPYVAIATTYLFHDLRVRERLEADERAPEVLPAEI